MPLFYILILVPILEVLVMMFLHQQLAEYLGFWPALLLVLLGVLVTAGIGLALLGREAQGVWKRFANQASSGTAPTQEMLEGLMLLVGGVCLLTPGYTTDLFGFICVFGKSRKKLSKWLVGRLKHLAVVQVFQKSPTSGGGGPFGGPAGRTDKEPPRRV